ncbi:MAG: WecB/TagA/CpsF family glycosyltransferase [Alphaproteobacteria bacterium]|nr:WecB/TagA/CpsF family glycosyltransferase [Alphaproteobacteria bacterium]
MNQIVPVEPAYPETWFLGVKLADLDVAAAARAIVARPIGAAFAYVVTPNAQHMVALHNGAPDLQAAYDAAWLRLSDSQVVRLLGQHLFGMALPSCAGSDLTAALFANHIQAADTICVIGGDDELRDRLIAQYGLQRLSLHQPPMGFIKDPAAVQAALDFVAAHPSRYIFLAVGQPRGEILARLLKERGDITGTGLCIGSSLHFITGLVQRAPEWMRRYALEWLHRLIRSPRTHFRRVFIESLPLLGMAVRARLAPESRRHLPRRGKTPA